jgi:hypothetical protein
MPLVASLAGVHVAANGHSFDHSGFDHGFHTVLVRLQPELAKPLDDWRREQADLPSRAEAIRRLVELGLKVKGKAAMGGRARS